MSSNHAIVSEKPGLAKVAACSIPTLRDDYIIVKVKAVALNPTDWKHRSFLTRSGVRLGCDYAGVVEQVGSKVTKPLKKGDRVCGMCHGGNVGSPEKGCFGEYITAKGDIQIVIPENLSFEEAATLGIGITTVGQGLYQSLKLPLPTEPASEKFPILIYGGSTATGSLAIQFAKLSGAEVITTCSPRNFDFVKSRGADKVFDYSSMTCAQDIKAYTNNALTHVLDCVAGDGPATICVSALADAGGIYGAIGSCTAGLVESLNPRVHAQATLGYTIMGETFTIGSMVFPARSEDLVFGTMFWELARELLLQGRLKVHPPAVNKYGNGLEGIVTGLDAMRDGRVSAEKLVYMI